MGLEFLNVVLGVLSGAWGVALNIASGEISKTILSHELNSLLENCLEEAVKQKSDFLNRFTGPTSPDGSRPKTYLDKKRLREYLQQNPLVKPLVSQLPSSTAWRPYLQPFMGIVIIPGCTLSESDHLDLIQGTLEIASRYFESSVPQKHPAFEELLLAYQKKHSFEHQQILREIESVSVKAAQEINQQITARDEKESEPTATSSTKWVNPFSVVAADDLELRNPDHVRQIRNLFIARYTDLPTIKKRFNTLLEGQRGTGKTMIMKYLAFETQILEWTETLGKKAQDFLSNPENFIGVYSKLGQGVFDKSDFEAIDNPARRERIFEHRLTLQLLYDVLETMKSAFLYYPPPPEQIRRIRRALQSYLKADGILDSSTNHNEFIRSAQDRISITLIPEVDEHLGSVSPGAEGKPADFNPRLTLSGQLVPFLDMLRESCGASVPFFLMLDDFDVLEPYQQARVFKTASGRHFGTVCFKFGLMVLGRKVMLSGPGRTFRPSDDYDLIDLDWTQGGLHYNYQEAILEIATARLKDANWPSDLSALLPKWQRGEEIWQEVKTGMEREWEAADKKPTVSRSDYISKYGNARFFQYLRKRKTRMRYAGFEYVTMVSSGIFRQFLEACKLIFDRAHDRGWLPDHGSVRPEMQDIAVREYSEDMMQQFTRTSGDAQALLSGDIEVTSLHIITLIDSLCDVFYSRLHTPGHKAPEIICIAIKDDLNRCLQADTYLKIAVRESVLHRFQYPPKTPGGPPLPTFMLNRRLGPRRDLSIARMQGRIEVGTQDIILALSDRKAFFQKMMGREVDDESPDQMPFGFDNASGS